MVKINLLESEVDVLFKGKTKEEVLKICQEEGLVYLGKGKVISKKDLDTVRTYVDAVRYGDDID